MVSVYPEKIQQILNRLNSEEEWENIWYDVSTGRDRNLTRTFSLLDSCGFILMDGEEAFLFQGEEWTVHPLGQPVFEVDPEMVEGVDFEDFLAELQYELTGVEVRRGSASNNAKSEFVQWFQDRFDWTCDCIKRNLS